MGLVAMAKRSVIYIELAGLKMPVQCIVPEPGDNDIPEASILPVAGAFNTEAVPIPLYITTHTYVQPPGWRERLCDYIHALLGKPH
jgi:hypothetical protein